MITFNGDAGLKAKIRAQLQAHYDADEIAKGVYWENGKGCAVGCTIHCSNHLEYEKQFGIPIQLAYLEDVIFENLPNGYAKEWPLRFWDAIPVEKDLGVVINRFLSWLINEELKHFHGDPIVGHAIVQIGNLFKISGDATAYAAADAAGAARDAVGAAADAASYAAAEAAAHAAYSAYAARAAAYSARAAAHAIAYATDDADAEYVTIRFSDKLIDLIINA